MDRDPFPSPGIASSAGLPSEARSFASIIFNSWIIDFRSCWMTDDPVCWVIIWVLLLA